MEDIAGHMAAVMRVPTFGIIVAQVTISTDGTLTDLPLSETNLVHRFWTPSRALLLLQSSRGIESLLAPLSMRLANLSSQQLISSLTC